MTSFDSALSPPLSRLSEWGVGPPLAQEPQHSGSPPATDGRCCRSPQHRLESSAPGAAASRAPSLTRPRGGCQAAVGQRGTPETHREARREAERTGETHAQREGTVVDRHSERQERGGPGSRRHRSGGHGRGAPRTHTRAYTGPHPLHTATHAPRLRCADSLQQSRVTTAQEGAGARRLLARTGGSWSCDRLLGSPHREPSPPSPAWRVALGITRAPFSFRDPKGTPAL